MNGSASDATVADLDASSAAKIDSNTDIDLDETITLGSGAASALATEKAANKADLVVAPIIETAAVCALPLVVPFTRPSSSCDGSIESSDLLRV